MRTGLNAIDFSGEVIDRNKVKNHFDFNDEELMPEFCDSLPAVNCYNCQSTTVDEIIDESIDIEAEVDLQLAKVYQRKNRFSFFKTTFQLFTAISLVPVKKVEINESMKNFEFSEDDLVFAIAPAYPHKEGMKARYRR